jgi:hypothetical protein
MVSAGRIGSFAKWSFDYGLGSDTTNAATKFGCDAVVDRCGTTGLWGADRRHVSCSSISVVVCRRHLLCFGVVSKEGRRDQETKLTGLVLLTAD